MAHFLYSDTAHLLCPERQGSFFLTDEELGLEMGKGDCEPSTQDSPLLPLSLMVPQ